MYEVEGCMEFVEVWPQLREPVLRSSRSRKVCMTCHFFRHRVAADGIPELTCELHRALIPQGVHLASRCQGWTDDLVRQQGWAPEAA
jgi:hypothetical protein